MELSISLTEMRLHFQKSLLRKVDKNNFNFYRNINNRKHLNVCLVNSHIFPSNTDVYFSNRQVTYRARAWIA